jgi:cytoskeletal protein RodZ
VESFGAYLKRERELRGISIREVAQTTKISSRAIDALEQERFEELGGEIFVRGFLRNYAKYLGLDPEDAILRYDEYRLLTSPPPESPPRIELPGLTPNPKSLFFAGSAAAAIVFITLIIFALSGPKKEAKVPEQVKLAALPPVVKEEAPAPVSEETAAPVSAPAVKAVVLRIEAHQPSYMKLWIDGGEPIERDMAVGSIMKFEAEQQIEVLAGNAGGITLFLNGNELPSLGPEGRVRRRVVTAEGVSPP